MTDMKDLLNDESNLFNHILNSIFDGVYITDMKRTIIFWNKGAEKLTGYSASEVMGRQCSEDILNHIDENGRQLCTESCPIEKVMENNESIIAKVYPLHKDGKRIVVQTHISPFLDENGNIIGAIEIFRDISKEENYRVLQEKFNLLIKKYVSSKTFADVQTRIKNDKLQTNSQQIDMTVMYIDVVGFTKLSEKIDVQEVVRILNSLFGVCEIIIKEFHGDIDKFIGDAVMAVFADPQDAVKSAIKILYEGLDELNRKFADSDIEPIKVRIGINSGIVIQGDIGNIDRKDLTVIGDAVNVAARIEKLAPHNKILVSEATVSRLNEKCCKMFKFFGEMDIRGKVGKIKVYVNE